jgi:excisionase family DNA binding protein
MSDRYMTVEEVTQYLSVTRDTLYRWLRDGRVPGHRVGRTWRFDKSELDEWVKSGAAADPATSDRDEN